MQAKSSLAIIILAAVIVELTSALQYWYAYKGIKEETKHNAQNELDIKSLEISRVMTGVEEAANNFAWILERHLQNPDTIYGLSDFFLKHTKNVVGCGLAFKPHYFPEKGKWYEPYTKKNTNGPFKHDQIGKESHDYLNMEFYEKTVEYDKGIWTEPYFDNEGAEMLLCTYTQPIHDKNGDVVGVFGADVSLDWLSNLINDSTSNQESVKILLSNKGTVIACPVESLEMKTDIMKATSNMTDTGVVQLNQNMLQGKSGNATIEDENGEKNMCFMDQYKEKRVGPWL